VNVGVDQLQPGVFGVSHGGGLAGEIIRTATQSSAGHAFLYLGGGLIVSGAPPKAVTEPADAYTDAVWAWRMWDALETSGWTPQKIGIAQGLVVSRGNALVGSVYDWAAYAAFAAEVLHLRNEEQLSGLFTRDPARVCSGLVADALQAGGVPLDFVPEDGPGLIAHPDTKVQMPPNLVTPGMLLGLAQRSEWL
jgi:hypothetical protein